jgi:ubiquinone biosynthesis protein Coq4
MFKDIALIFKLLSIQFKSGNYDTTFIAKFISHFNRNSLDTTMRVWAVTPTGKRYLEGDSIMNDLSQYKDTEGTLAREYYDFMEKYYYDKLSNVIDPKDWEAVKKANKIQMAYGRFMVDLHDFTHVLTGYPPTPLGEVLRIEYLKHLEGNGWKVISRVGKMRIFLNGFKEAYTSHLLYKEARQLGKFSKNYILADWFNILGEDINKVRENLNTLPTTKYHWRNA